MKAVLFLFLSFMIVNIYCEEIVCQVESSKMIICNNSTFILEEKDRVGSFLFYVDLGVVVFCILLGGTKKFYFTKL